MKKEDIKPNLVENEKSILKFLSPLPEARTLPILIRSMSPETILEYTFLHWDIRKKIGKLKHITSTSLMIIQV